MLAVLAVPWTAGPMLRGGKWLALHKPSTAATPQGLWPAEVVSLLLQAPSPLSPPAPATLQPLEQPGTERGTWMHPGLTLESLLKRAIVCGVFLICQESPRAQAEPQKEQVKNKEEMQLVQLSGGKRGMSCHFKSLNQTGCFFPQDTPHWPGALGVAVGGLWLELGWHNTAPALRPATYGAVGPSPEPRCQCICPATDIIPVINLNK